MIKSTLRRSIRRAQIHNLIARNVVELIDLPAAGPGRPSRAMTQAQASNVLKAASGQRAGFVKVVRAAKGRDGAAHAATAAGELACGNKPDLDATVTDVSAELTDTTCRTCRSQLGLDDSDEANGRLEALFVSARGYGRSSSPPHMTQLHGDPWARRVERWTCSGASRSFRTSSGIGIAMP